MKGYALLPDIVWNWTLNDSPRLNEEGLLIAVLAGIAQGGSVAKVARDFGYSYRHIWGLIRTWEERFRQPLVDMSRGRGSSLAPLGLQLVRLNTRMKSRFAAQLAEAAEESRRELALFLDIGSARLAVHSSHDLLLCELPARLRDQGIDLQVHVMGSSQGLRSLAEGHCEMAGFHCPDGPQGKLFWDIYRAHLDPEIHAVFRFVRRMQGLMVLPENPAEIHGIADLSRSGIRFVNRQMGSGTRILFDQLLVENSLSPRQISGYEIEEFTHAAVAATIASKAADTGLGVKAAAHRFGLDFIPLAQETFYLAIRQDCLQRQAVQSLLAFLSSPAWTEIVAAETGYEIVDSSKEVEWSDVLGTDKIIRKSRLMPKG
ncbi:MAG: PBP superfamily domain protein [Betaproteobacteria bacterium ADurb.Bin341]|nr:MAG: PBP superfamily domain protein [Betaproteobacteria bacterium ADurb.Bin341]